MKRKDLTAGMKVYRDRGSTWGETIVTVLATEPWERDRFASDRGAEPRVIEVPGLGEVRVQRTLRPSSKYGRKDGVLVQSIGNRVEVVTIRQLTEPVTPEAQRRRAEAEQRAHAARLAREALAQKRREGDEHRAKRLEYLLGRKVGFYTTGVSGSMVGVSRVDLDALLDLAEKGAGR